MGRKEFDVAWAQSDGTAKAGLLRCRAWPLLAALALASLPTREASAVSTHADGVDIDSTQSSVDFTSGVREYTGKVRVAHLNLRLRSDKLTEIRRNGKLVKVIAHGSPVQFEQLAPYTAEIRYARASRAEYSPQNGTLKLWNYTVWDVSNNRTRGKRGLYRFPPRL